MVNTWAQDWRARPSPSPSAPYQRQTFQPTWSSPYGYEPQKGFGSSVYDADLGRYAGTYSPAGTFTTSLIQSDMAKYLEDEAARLGYNNWGGSTTVGIGQVGNHYNGNYLGYFDEAANAEIQAAATKYGVPANFLKTIIHLESTGNWAENSTPACGIRGMCIHGYVGVFENAAEAWGFSFEQGIGNRAYQTEMLAAGLRGMYDRIRAENPQYDWVNVAAVHYSGDPSGNYTPPDSYQYYTTPEYMRLTQDIWSDLDADAGNGVTGQPIPGQEGGPVEGMTNLTAIWGGGPFEITQAHGPGWYSAQNPHIYEYSYDVLGELGHPGIDVGMPVGTPIYNAAPGVVVAAGGTGYYLNQDGYNASDSGEIRVRLANGDEIIYGHMSAFNYQVGDTVPAGALIGLSGYPRAPHIHLEVRIPDPSRPGGQRAVDPVEYFGGTFTGWLQSGQAPGLAASSLRPMSYAEMLRAVSEGKSIRTPSDTPGAITSFNDFLQMGVRGQSYEEALQRQQGTYGDPAALPSYVSRVYSQTRGGASPSQ